MPREPIPPIDPENPDPTSHSNPDPVTPPNDPSIEEEAVIDAMLDQLASEQNPHAWLNAIQNIYRIPPERRGHYFPQFITMVREVPAWEQDALLEAGRPVFRYRMESARRAIAEHAAGGTILKIAPSVEGPDFIAEVIYRKDETPNVKYLKYMTATGEIGIVDDITLGNTRYMPTQTRLVDTGTLLMPTGTTEYASDPHDTMSLVEQVFAFIDKYLYLEPHTVMNEEGTEHEEPNEFRNFCAYYVLLSWIFDRFDVVPYLRSQGEFGTGKTRMLQVIGALTYRSIFAGGATTAAPIFRIIERFHGTLIIDEADFSDKSEIWSEITKILNTGYQRGFPVLRAEKKASNDQYDAEAYDCYSPKLLSTRNRFADQALESRCLTHVMHRATIPARVPLILGPDFRVEAGVLRNKLLLWRCRNYHRVHLDPCERFAGLDSRLNQLLLPLLAVCDNEDLRGQILQEAQKYQRRLKEDLRDSFPGRMARCVVQAADRAIRSGDVRCKLCHDLRAQPMHQPNTTHRDAHTFEPMAVTLLGSIVDRAQQEFDDRERPNRRRIGDTVRNTFKLPTFLKGGDTYVIVVPERIDSLRHTYGLAESQPLESAQQFAAALATTNGTAVHREPIAIIPDREPVLREPIPPVEPVRVAFLITQAMENGLRSRGFTDDQINALTPQAAQDILEGDAE